MLPDIRFSNVDCRKLFDYWRGLSKEGAVPRWSDFDPLHIPRLLPFVLILEAEPERGCVVRLAGTEWVEFYGRELRGQTLDSLVAEEGQEELRAHLQRVLQGPSAAVTLMKTPVDKGDRASLSYTLETVALPMAGEDGTVYRILAAMFVVEAPPSAPPIGPAEGAWRRDIQDRQYISLRPAAD